MCNIIAEISKPCEVTGYKIALLKRGVYRSPSTMLPYNIGKIGVPSARNLAMKESSYSYLVNPMLKGSVHFDERHIGHTQLFTSRKAAGRFSHYCYTSGYKVVILEVKGIAKYDAWFDGAATLLIDEILSMEQCK